MRIGRILSALLAGLVAAAWFAQPVLGALAEDSQRTRGQAQVRSDFNGDGFSDLAVAASWETVNGKYAAGGVNVLYGSPAGLTAAGNQFWTQDSPGIADSAETGDNFGSAMASGDFNGDGLADLAVGAPYEATGSRFSNGTVTVILGSASGLTSTGSQVVPGTKFDDRLGYSLAAGDFDADGFTDLASGLPDRIVDGLLYAGATEILYGSGAGLNGGAPEVWTQNTPGVPDHAESGDSMGWAVAAGDFNGDGADDLAASAYEEGVNAADEAGAVTVIYGSTGVGLTSAGSQFWSQDSPGIDDQSEDEDEFGYAMAAGDFNGDGASELVVGSFGESIGSATYAGAANVIYGSNLGLTASGNQLWTQGSPGVPGELGLVARFGSALATGDFNGDAIGDLAVGVPGQSEARHTNSGATNILYGSADGLTSAGAQLWSQGSPGIQDQPEDGDFWGGAVATGDWNGDGRADLAGAAIYESYPQVVNYPGAINVIYGGAGGLSATGSQLWTQNSPGVQDKSEADDFFGYAMA